MLTVYDTTKSYSGKPGCMCGCNGTYNESARARKTAITQLLNNPAVKLQEWNPSSSGGDAGCLYVETPTRNRVLYLTRSGVAKLAAQFPEMVDKP
jgi:hypothetical protein